MTQPKVNGMAGGASTAYDAVIVGSGPNGLGSAITLARAGWRVLILEAAATPGGGMRTQELTLPGFQHDICATVLTTGLVSPFIRSLPLDEYGLQWIDPPASLAHPLDGGRAAVVERSVEATAAGLGVDAAAYRRIFTPLVRDWQQIMSQILGPLPLPPRHISAMLRFGLRAIQPASLVGRTAFRGELARGLFAGLAGHSILPLHRLATTAFGLVLNIGAHAVGWQIAQSGTQRYADAIIAYFKSLGGELVTSLRVNSLADIPPARAVLFDVTPREFLRIAGDKLPPGYRRSLERFRYGPGVCKVDLALDGPIPWTAAECARAGTVHVGGTLEEIEAAEAAVWRGEHPAKPFVLLVQPTLFDPSRAPQGKHIAWAYCHVPHGSTRDVSAAIEAQIERFAPGFRDLILARHVFTAAEMEAYNPNYVGGDINSGVQDLTQLFTRPVPQLNPYRTPLKGVYLCSSSTPPGGGVHGMSGYHAARSALRD
jgi:phytoene dehydrogenase-like protein